MKKIITLAIVFASLTLSYGQQNVKAILTDVFNDFPNVRDISISSNGNELYFTAQSIKQDFSAIMISNKRDNEWSIPKIVSFSGQYKDLEPFLSHNGLIMYFASNRPVKGVESDKLNFDIWKVQRFSSTDKWLEPINLGSKVNTLGDEFYPSVADNENLYFTASFKNGKGKEDIYVSEFKNGDYLLPISLPQAINSEGYEFNAYVAPDEKYLIFTGYRREGGLGRGDLYISKKNEQGEWGSATHLQIGINSTGIDYCPFVQNGLLYFTSDRSAIKPNYGNRLSTNQLLKEFNKTENGKSRIYQVVGDDWLGN